MESVLVFKPVSLGYQQIVMCLQGLRSMAKRQ